MLVERVAGPKVCLWPQDGLVIHSQRRGEAPSPKLPPWRGRRHHRYWRRSARDRRCTAQACVLAQSRSSRTSRPCLCREPAVLRARDRPSTACRHRAPGNVHEPDRTALSGGHSCQLYCRSIRIPAQDLTRRFLTLAACVQSFPLAWLKVAAAAAFFRKHLRVKRLFKQILTKSFRDYTRERTLWSLPSVRP